MFLTRMLYVIKDLVTMRKRVVHFARKVILLTSAFFLSLICPKHTRRSAACQYTQEYMKTFYYFYSHAFWWTLKCFLPGTFSHWIEFNYIGLHWIVTDALEKKKILILVIHSVVTQEVPSMPLLLSWLRTMQWFCVPLSKWGQLPLSSEFKIPHPSYKGVLQHALSSSFRHIFYYKSQIAHSFLCNWLWPFPT